MITEVVALANEEDYFTQHAFIESHFPLAPPASQFRKGLMLLVVKHNDQGSEFPKSFKKYLLPLIEDLALRGRSKCCWFFWSLASYSYISFPLLPTLALILLTNFYKPSNY